jgi:DNA-directed RNA polymerase specialized sigma24 family protein
MSQIFAADSYADHRSWLLAWLRGWVRWHERAADVVQDLFCKFLRMIRVAAPSMWRRRVATP